MQYSVTFNPTSLHSNSSSVNEDSMLQEWQEIQRAQQNPVLFRPLYDRYYEPIFRFVHRRTGDQTLSADLCSEVFYKAMQKLKKYQYKGVPFSAWLYRIASNEVTQYFRNSTKNRMVSIETATLPTLFVEMGDLEESDKAQLQKTLLISLNQLRTSDLELIELRFFEQRPFKEIATILDISESSCKMRTYRILERLKKMMGG